MAYRQKTDLSGTDDENDIVLEPVSEDEIVTDTNTQPPHYFYMHTSIIDSFHIWFPFTAFEIQIFKTMNVDPCQLSPNSWCHDPNSSLVMTGAQTIAN